MQRIEAYPVLPEAEVAEWADQQVVPGDVYVRIELGPPGGRQILLKDWASMAGASKAQDRIRDNALLREHEG